MQSTTNPEIRIGETWYRIGNRDMAAKVLGLSERKSIETGETRYAVELSYGLTTPLVMPVEMFLERWER